MDPNYGYVQSAPQNSGFKFSRKTLLIAGGLIIAIIIGIVLLSGSQKGISVQAQHLVARYSNLQAMLSDKTTTRNLKNQDLSNIVTSSNLSVTTDIQDLNTALAGHIPAKLDSSIAAAEVDTTTAKTVEEAYLENKLDAVYADILIKKIKSIRALIAETYGLSKDQELKATLQNLDDHLRKTKQQLEELKL